jgi:signal peptide peptidase SppA
MIEGRLCGLWALERSVLDLLPSISSDPATAGRLAAFFEPVAAVKKMPGAGGKSIALLQVSGVMMKQPSWLGGTSTLQLRQDLRDAAADPEVGAILLSIDSPGGSVSGMADLAAETKAAGRQKPVWSQVSDIGGSAAYWLASQTSRIVANSPLTMVGSIGVYNGPFFDVSGMLEKEGVKAFFPASGPLKGAFTPGPPITDIQKAYANEITAHVFEQFKSAVAKARGLGQKAMDAVTHGGIMPAQKAMDAGLIDAIQPATKTMSDLAAAMKQPRAMAAETTNLLPGRSGAVLPMVARQALPMQASR